MVKKNLDEPCIFCGCAPCECEPRKQTKAKVKKPSAPIVASSSQPSSDLPFSTPEPIARFKTVEQDDERDLSLENALMILRPLCSPKSQSKIDKLLHRPLPQSVDRRISEWSQRHV